MTVWCIGNFHVWFFMVQIESLKSVNLNICVKILKGFIHVADIRIVNMSGLEILGIPIGMF